MVWKERSRVDERVLLVSEYMKGEQADGDIDAESDGCADDEAAGNST